MVLQGMGTTIDSAEVMQRFHEALPTVQQQAHKIAKTIGRAADMDELVSYGNAGLLEAARRYDPSRGVPFRAFATFRIRGAMLDGVRQLAYLPRRVHERLRALESANEFSAGALEDVHAPGQHSHAPEDEERRLVEHLAGMATAMATGLVSQPVVDDAGDTTLVAQSPSPEELSSRQQLLALVAQGIEDLPEQEAILIRRHYIDGDRLDLVAAELGLSKSWASRLHTRAIGRLTKRLCSRTQ